MPKKERRGKLPDILMPIERVETMEAWEALSELMSECLIHDVEISIRFDTGRYSDIGSDEVIQGPQGWTLEIAGHSYDVGGKQKLYRSIEELVNDGWRIMSALALATDRLEDTEL